MKKWKWATALIMIGVVASYGGLRIFLTQPVFGSLPDGGRLARIERSPNYAAGTFQNQEPSPILTAGSTELSIWREELLRRGGQARPPGPIPSLKTNLKTLDPAQDCVVWLGHSSLFIQLAGQRILVDPVLSTNAAPIPRANVAFNGASPYTTDDIPPVDLVLISHDHYDHLDYPTMLALRDKIKHVVVGLGVGADLERWGYDASAIVELDWLQERTFENGLKIVVTPARHFSGRTLVQNKTLWVGFALLAPSRRLFVSGDTGYDQHFADLGRRYGPFDLVALEDGQYDPRWANIHMTPEQMAQAAQDLRAKALLPEHNGKFSLAPHDWDDPYKRVVAASSSRAYALWTPLIGQPVALDSPPSTFRQWWNDLTTH